MIFAIRGRGTSAQKHGHDVGIAFFGSNLKGRLPGPESKGSHNTTPQALQCLGCDSNTITIHQENFKNAPVALIDVDSGAHEHLDRGGVPARACFVQCNHHPAASGV